MIPIPQYPLYSASVSLFGGHAVPYYLNEEQDWATNMSDIRHALHEARQKGHCDVRAIVLINPSNPTGSVLLAEQIKEVLHFAYEQRLLVLADEVYQTNIYQPDERPFFSFKKALSEMPQHIAKAVELVSFHSISKGFIGECGRRGGFFELVNIDPDVEAQLYKLMSSQLCSPVSGQIAVDLMVRPPPPGAPSHKRYFEELNAIEASLHERAQLLRQAFTHMEGYTCSHSQVRVSAGLSVARPKRADFSSSRITGSSVFVPTAAVASESHRRCQGSRERAGPVLLLTVAQKHRHLCGAWFRLWAKRRHAALPNHIPAASDQAVCRAHSQLPPRVHGQVPLDTEFSLLR